MAQSNALLVKELRDRTGVGMGKCKNALEEAAWDLEAAVDLLRKAGMAQAAKKESRETNEGTTSFAQDDNSIALIEIKAETDFVVQNDRFKEFVKLIAQDAINLKPKSIEEFLQMTSSTGKTVEDYRVEQVQSLGENIQINRVLILPKQENCSIGIYSHMKGKILSVVEIEGAGDAQDLAKEVAMHAAAEFPEYLSPEEIPQDVKDREIDVAKAQMKGKPANIIDKILEGKMRAFYESTCLLNQKFVKDSSMTVEQFVTKSSPKAKIKQFIRWQIGA